VFYEGGIAAAVMRNTAVSGSYGMEFMAFVIGFFEKWHYYEGAYHQNGGSFRLLVWNGIS